MVLGGDRVLVSLDEDRQYVSGDPLIVVSFHHWDN